MNTIVSYAVNNRMSTVWMTGDKTGQELADMLKAENARSLSARYGERGAKGHFSAELVDPIVYKRMDMPGNVRLLKLLDCYDYQACESDNYPETEAAKFINRVRKCAISGLPGYDDAPWGMA